MPYFDEKCKLPENKYLSQLQDINNESVLIAALDEVKNEFLGNADFQLNSPTNIKPDVEDVDDQNFNARKSIYNLLKSCHMNGDAYERLATNLEKYHLPLPITTKLLQICRVQICRIETSQGTIFKEHSLIPKYESSTWSVDIDLSSSYAMKLLESSITFNLNIKETNSNSEQCTTKSIVMTSEKFSELRYKVAEALKTLNDLKKRKMFSPS